MIGFEKPGYKNSPEAIRVMKEAVEARGIRQVVVASTRGATGLDAARALKGSGARLVVVTHNYGFKEPGTVELEPSVREELEAMGASVHTGTMAFRNIGTAIRETLGYSQQDLIANTLRIFGQGMKVCVEIALMAADAGLLSPAEDAVAVAGTARGADTVVILRPASSNRLFDLKVREVLAKPVDW